MPRKCTICTDKKRHHINKASLNPKKSLRDIAVQYGKSTSTLQRHLKLHLLPAMKLVKREAELKEGKTAFELFNEMLKEAEKKYRATSGTLQMGWFREWRGMMDMAYKLGIEDERRREQNTYTDVTPAVKAIIDKEFEK